jgi:hypothetical protein
MSQLRNRDACLTLSDDSDRNREFLMKRLIGAILVAAAFGFSVPATIDQAAAAPQAKSAVAQGATDIGARRYYRHHHYRHYGYRPYYRPAYQPYYYARPHYYRPYPYYAPAPFPFGLGFGPFW